MQINSYVNQHEKITIDTFLNLNKRELIRFDFLTQGIEGDRTVLTNEIYRKIFPWFNSEKHAGDTLNTYRIAIFKYYGKYYPNLDRSTQTEIDSIIQQHTIGTSLFEFEYATKSGTIRNNISNNNQIGNFGILPKSFGINPKRAQAPYYDYFDQFLSVIATYYGQGITPEDPLKNAILNQSDYFNQFENFYDFIERNFLWDFFYKQNGNYYRFDLSELESFESYIERVNLIISKRGERIYNYLHEISAEATIEESSTQKRLWD